jgi:hypothetical protein
MMESKVTGISVTRIVTLNQGKESYSSVKMGATVYVEYDGAEVEEIQPLVDEVQEELREVIGEQLRPFLPFVYLIRHGNDAIRADVEELFLGAPVEKD